MSEVRDQALEVARGWSAQGAPRSWQLTAALFDAIAGDEELLQAVATLPADRLPALLAAAAITLLARRDRSALINLYLPEPGAPQPPLDGRFPSAYTTFRASHLDEIMGVCRQRRYQMNEVARCTQIAPGIAAACKPSEQPIALVDLGTGAGIALELDCYHYSLGHLSVGPSDSGVQLSCSLRGGLTPPFWWLPGIAERIGIDIDPIDVEDANAREWLAACTPPETESLSRMSAAVDVVRRHPPTIIAGDVVEVLPEVLDRIPRNRTVVAVDSYTAVFLPEDRRQLLAEVLAEAGRVRKVIWLSLDPLVPLGPAGRRSVQDLDLPPRLVEDYQERGVFAVLGMRRFGDDIDHGRLLARSHPSGMWMEWLDDSARPR